MVPPASHKLTGVRGTQDASQVPAPAPTGLSPSLAACSNAFGSARVPCCWSYNPCPSRKTTRFGLVPPRSPLLRESRLISLRRATEMFQFAHCPPSCLYIQQAVSRHHSGRVAPFGISGLFARMQLPLNVSPVSASFFGLQRLGIHRVLSLACALLVARLRLLLFAPSPLHLFRSRSRPTPPRHATHRDLSSRHTHSRFLCFSRSLSSCLGNIEVIILMQL